MAELRIVSLFRAECLIWGELTTLKVTSLVFFQPHRHHSSASSNASSFTDTDDGDTGSEIYSVNDVISRHGTMDQRKRAEDPRLQQKSLGGATTTTKKSVHMAQVNHGYVEGGDEDFPPGM